MGAEANRERVRALRERLARSGDLEAVIAEVREILESECKELAKAEVG